MAWILTRNSKGKWQLPPEGEEVILRIGAQFLIGYYITEDDEQYFHVEGCLDCLDYSLDDVHSWQTFTRPLGVR